MLPTSAINESAKVKPGFFKNLLNHFKKPSKKPHNQSTASFSSSLSALKTIIVAPFRSHRTKPLHPNGQQCTTHRFSAAETYTTYSVANQSKESRLPAIPLPLRASRSGSDASLYSEIHIQIVPPSSSELDLDEI
uniref:Uncharacterized protein n=1 Tax=Psilocybe cubensis TaxID=181762 RepID=A0A8H7XU06_PSICU